MPSVRSPLLLSDQVATPARSSPYHQAVHHLAPDAGTSVSFTPEAARSILDRAGRCPCWGAAVRPVRVAAL